MLADRHPRGSKVLVVGAEFLSESVHAVGLKPVRLAEDKPVAVVQGHSPDTGWRNLAEACIALRTGADWVACNVDSTLPTDRGLLPGNGAMVQALRTATGLEPRVAGKPKRPLLDEAVRRAGAARPLVVGDRLDTDIEAGVAAALPSLLVLSGVSTPADLLVAPVHQRPTHLAMDLRSLTDDRRYVVLDGQTPSGWTVSSAASGLELRAAGDGAVDTTTESAAQIDDFATLSALAALTGAAWKRDAAEQGPTMVVAADSRAGAALHRLRLA